MSAPKLIYDDVFPVDIMGNDLLDRHNDRIAVFEPTFEIEDRQRILRAINSYTCDQWTIKTLMAAVQDAKNTAISNDAQSLYRRMQKVLALVSEPHP